jgi:ABC-type dipeptide/oligopeptide/nickel transport system permease subunit
MKDFLRTYWLWILVPFVIVLVAVAAFLFFTDAQASSPFTYGQ